MIVARGQASVAVAVKETVWQVVAGLGDALAVTFWTCGLLIVTVVLAERLE